jgi:hypothetical protein
MTGTDEPGHVDDSGDLDDSHTDGLGEDETAS